MVEWLKCVGIALAWVLGLTGFALIMVFITIKAEHTSDDIVYNNNICTECETKEAFELYDIEYIKNSGTVYFYKCKNCNYIIKLYNQVKEIEKREVESYDRE